MALCGSRDLDVTTASGGSTGHQPDLTEVTFPTPCLRSTHIATMYSPTTVSPIPLPTWTVTVRWQTGLGVFVTSNLVTAITTLLVTLIAYSL